MQGRIERLIFAVRPKISLADYLRLCWGAIRKKPRAWAAFAIACLAVFTFSQFYSLRFALTESMPYTIVLVEEWRRPAPGEIRRGDLVAWRWPGGLIYPEGAVFLKIVKGLPGDNVSIIGRDYWIAGEYAGRAKTVSRLGHPLEAARHPETIPDGHYYLYAPHKDSLDSRYQAVGLVPHERIIGRAYALF